MNIKKLMHVADRAKTIGAGNFQLPNAVFAILLEEYFSQIGGEYKTLSLSLETQDRDGVQTAEAYYDIFVLSLSGEDGVIASLCIPAPLLQPSSLVTAMKSASLVDREEHLRVLEGEVEPDEMQTLWESVFEEVNSDTYASATTAHLVEGCVDDSSVVLSRGN